MNLSVHKAPVSHSHETSRFQADAESILALPLAQRGWLIPFALSCALCIQEYYHWQVINKIYLFEIYQNIFNIYF